MDACFFDVDGTLFDTRADLCATVNHTRRDLGFADLPMDKILSLVGQGAKNLLRRAIPERGDEVEMLWEIFRSHYNEHLLENVTLYPGVRETLSALRERGWLLGINTAKPNFAVRTLLEHFGLSEFFGDAVVAGGDSREMKPSALPLIECAEKMPHTLSPSDWMVGDNWTDVECAANAGVKGAFCDFGFGILRGGEHCDARLAQMTDLLNFCSAEI